MATIDVGIDLGTTNSSVALIQQGRPQLVPNFRGDQTTASVVHLDGNGTVTIGRQALDRLVRDPENARSEFKRLMGQAESMVFPASGIVKTPAELSADVLNSLLADVERYAGNRPIAAVVTVPAAFDLNQCAATEEATRLAGLQQVHLLQEPVAASLAFGYRLDLAAHEWLVFDLGGGTFDLALVGVRDGVLDVLDHEGDNYLGGKNFDWALLEDVVLPRIAERHSVGSFIRANPARARDLMILRALAEEAKKELTVRESAVLSIELRPGQLVDDDGRDINLDISVTRDEFERAIAPTVERAIRLTHEVLDRNPGVAPEAVLLVGGPTLIPSVRLAVEQGLGLRVDSSINPFTAIAEGAAWYAATQPMEVHRSSSTATGSRGVDLRLDFKQVTEDEVAIVGIPVTPGVATVELSALDRTWSSGRMDVHGTPAVLSVPLPVYGTHTYNVEARGPDGTLLPLTAPTITITRGLVARAAPLSKTLGVVIEGLDAAPRYDPLLSEGTALPARSRREYRTTVALEPGDATPFVSIQLQEGESSNPYRNRRVGEVIISGRDVSRRVPAGIPVEVTIEVSESRLLRARAYFSMLDQAFDAELHLGADEVTTDSLRGAVVEEQQRLDELAIHLSAGEHRELRELVSQAQQEVAAAAGGDADARMSGYRRVQDVQTRLDRIERAQELPAARAAAREELALVTQAASEIGNESHRARLNALRVDTERADENQSLAELQRARRRLAELRMEILTGHPLFWIEVFHHLSAEVSEWTNAAVARELIHRGQLEIQREDFDALRETVRELYRVMSPDAMGRDPYRDVGITL